MEDTLQTPTENYFVSFLWIDQICKFIVGMTVDCEYYLHAWIFSSTGLLTAALFLHLLYYLFCCNFHSYNKTRHLNPCVDPNILGFIQIISMISGTVVLLLMDFKNLQAPIAFYASVISNLGLWWMAVLFTIMRKIFHFSACINATKQANCNVELDDFNTSCLSIPQAPQKSSSRNMMAEHL